MPHLPRKMDMINRSGTDQVMTQTFNRRKLSSYWSVTFVFFLVPRALQILPQIPHKRELFSCPPWSLLVSTQTHHLWLSISTWTALSVSAQCDFCVFLVPRALQILPQIPHKRELFSCPPWSLLVSTQTHHLWLSISTWTALSVSATPLP